MQKPKPATVFHGLVAVLALVVFAGAGFLGETKGQSRNKVDLVLLLALDVSSSIDDSEYELMRKGMANALLNPELSLVVAAGKHRVIAVSVVQWSGFQEQIVKINWTKISSREDFVALAAKVARMTRRYHGGATDIGGAIKFSREMIVSAPFLGTRKIIDIAGDGVNNVNASPSFERDKTVAQGIIINGLAIVGEAFVLVDYFKDFVIGGRGAFVEKARDYDSFETAMTRKLQREIGLLKLF